MSAEDAAYVRLPGRGIRRGFFAVAAGRCRLHFAADHLLAVESSIGSESYRRFYFRDIEAFVVRQTARRRNLNIVFVIFAALCAAPMLLLRDVDFDASPFYVLAGACSGFWLLLALINSLRGPSCETYVRTAVQLELLPSLGRLRPTRRALQILTPLIEGAQGTLTPQEQLDAPWAAGNVSTGAAAALYSPTAPAALRHLGGKLHFTLFGALLLDALFGLLHHFTGNMVVLGIGMIVTLLGAVLCLIALVQQGGTDVPAPVRWVVITSTVYYGLSLVTAFVYQIIYAVRHEGEAVVTGLEIVSEPGFGMVLLTSAVTAGVLGLLGLLLAIPHWARSEAPPAAS